MARSLELWSPGTEMELEKVLLSVEGSWGFGLDLVRA
jgi:hypothetical protein